MPEISRVSVIIPVRDSAATIRHAIDSVLDQSCGAPEVTVVDDGSNDSTARILKSYGDRIKVLRQRNCGPSAARNAGATAASHRDYIAFLDADDVWLPEMANTMVKRLDEAQRSVLGFCDVITVDDNGRELSVPLIDDFSAHAPSMDELLTRWWPILTSATVMRREAFDCSGGFSEAFTSPGYEDAFLWLMLREQGEFLYVPEPLVRYQTAPPMQRMLKYSRGGAVFGRLVRERYGSDGKRLMKETRSAFLAALGHEGLIALRMGDKLLARQIFARALRYGPLHFRTLSRWLRTFLPLGAAKALSGSFVHSNDTQTAAENLSLEVGLKRKQSQRVKQADMRVVSAPN